MLMTWAWSVPSALNAVKAIASLRKKYFPGHHGTHVQFEAFPLFSKFAAEWIRVNEHPRLFVDWEVMVIIVKV